MIENKCVTKHIWKRHHIDLFQSVKWDKSMGWSNGTARAPQRCSVPVPFDWLLKQSIGEESWVKFQHHASCHRKFPIEPHQNLKTLDFHLNPNHHFTPPKWQYFLLASILMQAQALYRHVLVPSSTDELLPGLTSTGK